MYLFLEVLLLVSVMITLVICSKYLLKYLYRFQLFKIDKSYFIVFLIRYFIIALGYVYFISSYAAMWPDDHCFFLCEKYFG